MNTGCFFIVVVFEYDIVKCSYNVFDLKFYIKLFYGLILATLLRIYNSIMKVSIK